MERSRFLPGGCVAESLALGSIHYPTPCQGEERWDQEGPDKGQSSLRLPDRCATTSCSHRRVYNISAPN